MRNLLVIYVCHTQSRSRSSCSLVVLSRSQLPSLLPTLLQAHCLSACAPGVLSVQREVVRFAGMGALLKSLQKAVVLMRHTWSI